MNALIALGGGAAVMVQNLLRMQQMRIPTSPMPAWVPWVFFALIGLITFVLIKLGE